MFSPFFARYSLSSVYFIPSTPSAPLFRTTCRYALLRLSLDNICSISLICDFCSSDQRFAYSFLQILPRDRHPCCSAIHFPLSGHVRDLHPLERAHGAQTQKSNRYYSIAMLLLLRDYIFPKIC